MGTSDNPYALVVMYNVYMQDVIDTNNAMPSIMCITGSLGQISLCFQSRPREGIVIADLRSISVSFNPLVPGLPWQRHLPTGAEKQLKSS